MISKMAVTCIVNGASWNLMRIRGQRSNNEFNNTAILWVTEKESIRGKEKKLLLMEFL